MSRKGPRRRQGCLLRDSQPLLRGANFYGYLGGSGDDAAYAVSIRGTGVVWIGGETRSSDFPFPNTGLAGPSDGFLAEVNAPVYVTGAPPATVATYRFGGNGEDSIRALAAAASAMTAGLGSTQVLRPFTTADIGFAGTTTSTDLPVRNAARPQFAGERDGFAGMWNVTAAAPRWVTYLGGSGTDEVTAVTEDWAGDLYVGGWTRSTDLPVVHALQPANAGGEDGMFAVFDSAGVMHHLTYFGGRATIASAVRLIYGSVARVAGSTTSTDLPQRARRSVAGRLRASGPISARTS
ncbi:MAG: SBBP repeat-containing protein [Bryobacterales bacterium]|nr:SBBP repeat-containing protein [Bryobacterales bacterium]